MPAYVNDESLQLPSNWDKMPVDSSGIEKPFHTFPLPSTSREYKDVEQEVLRTGLGRIHQILTISRIQNPQLYIPYAVRKAAMDKANRSTNNERMLFHGTSPKCCEAISHYGFNRSFAGTHGKHHVKLIHTSPILSCRQSYMQQYRNSYCMGFALKKNIRFTTSEARNSFMLASVVGGCIVTCAVAFSC